MRLRVLLAGALAALAIPAAASADTFCVNHSGCADPGHNFTTITAALTASNANGIGTPDTVDVGAGTYAEDVTVAVGNPVTIIGSGDATHIAPSSTANNQDVVTVRDPSTSISSLKITLPPSVGDRGLVVDSGIGSAGPSFSHIDVDNAPSEQGGTGVALYGSRFSDGNVTLTAPFALAAGVTDSTVTDSTFSAYNGLQVATAHTSKVTVTGSRVTCTGNACFGIGDDGALSVLAADDLIKTISPNGKAVFALGEPTTFALDQSTLIGAGASSTGVSSNSGLPGQSSTVNLDGVLIRNFGTDISTSTSGVGTSATINVKYSDFDPVKTAVSGSNAAINETVPGSDLHAIDPMLNLDGTLQSGSPAIDRGDPAQPIAGEPAVDLAGHPRKVDGDHSGTATIDMGAFEFQPPNHAPIAVLKAPRKVTAGKPVTFDGSSSSDPDHDPITYAWRFGDGGTSTAVKPSHVYENPGRYTVRLVVTDEFGAASAAATRTIVVSKPTGCVVPKLHGKSLAAAKRALRKAHCAIGKITHKHSRLVKPGHVIASKPRAHARRRAGSKVALIIAR